jgi:hypothetical protein
MVKTLVPPGRVGNYYVSLLAHGPTVEPNTTTGPIEQTTLFNETLIGPFISQEDIPVTGEDDTEMLQIVDDHCRGLKIDDSKEMMVGIAYGMPFELEQFGLFHVSMHIDATENSTKNLNLWLLSHPRIHTSVCSLFYMHFFLVSKVGHTSGCFKLCFPFLLEKKC